MPIDAIYSDSALLRGVNNSGCVKTDTDISYTNLRGEPVVTDISDRKMCTSDMFKPDQFLANTEGCCVLDTSETNCTDIAEVDAAEENNYYMGIRYKDVANPTYGERKICYTTPIRKKKLHIMDLLTKVLMDIIIFIVMVLVAACYEYWIIYGGCSIGGIQTSLYESPYKVGNHAFKQPIVKHSNVKKEDCPDNTENISDGTGLEWYDTFPYNLISFLNTNEGYNGSEKDTSKIFDLLELLKIPARSLLLGFFYCIIFSRIAMKGLIGLVNHIGSYIYNKEPNKYSQFMSGLIFIVVFMGIYGTLTDKFLGAKQPFLNASSLLILSIIIIVTVWIPSLFSFVVMMLTFVGYRRGTYDKYKDEKLQPPEKNTKATVESGFEYLYSLFDWYWVIEILVFTLKVKLTGKDGKDEDVDKLYSKDSKNNFNINNENDLDWFFPIRRSKLEMGLWSPWIIEKFYGLFHFNFWNNGCTKNSIPDSSSAGLFENLAKYYWWLHNYAYNPYKLLYLYTPLEVDCEEFHKVTDLRGGLDWLKRGLFAFFFTFIFSIPLIRFWIFWLAALGLIALGFLLVLGVFLFTFIVITIAMYSIFIALLGNILALFYLHFYVIIGFFYVPFTRYTQLFKIIKSHGNILTLLFCMIVVLAGVKVLHPTSVGVIGGILGLLILYKLITLLSV